MFLPFFLPLLASSPTTNGGDRSQPNNSAKYVVGQDANNGEKHPG
jgi:hypothetical protein